MTENQRLIDRILRHKVYLLGYAKHITERIGSYLDATEPEMRKELLDIFGPNAGESRVITRLRDAEARLFGIRSRAWNRSYEEMVRLLLEMAKFEPELLESPTQFDEGMIRGVVARALIVGQTLKSWWRALKDADIRRILTELRVSVLGGEDITKLLRRLAGKISAVANAAKSSVGTLANTAIAAVSGAVRKLVVKASDAFVWELWVSILDSRTTPTCRDLDGQLFPQDEGPQPGYHFNCRSERVPLIADGGDYNTRLSFREWASLQPAGFRRYVGTKDFNVKKLRPLTWFDVREREERDNQ